RFLVTGVAAVTLILHRLTGGAGVHFMGTRVALRFLVTGVAAATFMIIILRLQALSTEDGQHHCQRYSDSPCANNFRKRMHIHLRYHSSTQLRRSGVPPRQRMSEVHESLCSYSRAG